MFRAMISRVLQSRRYWFSVLLITAVMIFSESENLKIIVAGVDNFYALDLIVHMILFDRSRAMIAGIAGGICGIAYCEVRENRYDQYCLMRISPWRYGGSWLAANLLLVVVSFFLAFFLFYGLLVLRIPAVSSDTGLFGPYREWGEAFPVNYILLLSGISGMSLAVLSLAGMIMVSLFPSRYVAVGVPVIAVEFLYGFGDFLPVWLDFYSVSTASTLFPSQGPVFHFIYTTLYFGMLYLALGLIFIKQVKRV